MTLWRIPQYGGQLLGRTQGTPTAPRGLITSSQALSHNPGMWGLCVLADQTLLLTSSFIAGADQRCLCSLIWDRQYNFLVQTLTKTPGM